MKEAGRQVWTKRSGLTSHALDHGLVSNLLAWGDWSRGVLAWHDRQSQETMGGQL